ncbi:MAG: hypothetical protein IPJ89_03820 [Candidatus Iainarchaeum archaeon]|uniref:Uncharacterized protein n=1 Tax=Candidatus Iainarchaeum sp. TaxID=3101447 RepID=A0A7T9DJ19_9ARCH|nr:MAG: hypothetical protein IPJ89_03820 [Candidatus Diapherotrites archaeon]
MKVSRRSKPDPRILVVVLVVLVLLVVLNQFTRPTGNAIGRTINPNPVTTISSPTPPTTTEMSWYYDCDAPGMIDLCPFLCATIIPDEEKRFPVIEGCGPQKE